MNCPRLCIAGVSSGAGKTSLSLALTAALRRRGLTVQTFKVGPDYLDPTYLAIASGRPCYNLDGWMTSRAYVEGLFSRACRGADFAIIEGGMGLFDGASPDSSAGSTADVARWLDTPIVLAANVQGMTRSLAPLVKGFTTFEPGVRIAGVIANRCGSARHESWLSKVLAASSLPRLLGAVPREALPVVSRRNLGISTLEAKRLSPFTLEELADAFERYVSLDKIVRIAQETKPLPEPPPRAVRPAQERPFRLGVSRDEAFSFQYQDFLDVLQEAGCEPCFFSPLRDAALPKNLDGLYLTGGYPEEYAADLTANRGLCTAVRRFAASGRPLYAEGGGLIYLTQRIISQNKGVYDLAGVLPVGAQVLAHKKVLWYVEVELKADSLWGRKGTVLRGHEFHYSGLDTSPQGVDGWQSVYDLKRPGFLRPVEEGFQKGSVLASHVHLHLASHPEAIDYFMARGRSRARSTGSGGDAS